MDSTEKKFTTSTLVAAAGCEVGTFQKWRSRNGLFPETLGGTGWSKFSIIDICLVRLIVILTEQGVSASAAVWFAREPAAWLHFDRLLNAAEREAERFIGFRRGDETSDKRESFIVIGDREPVAEVMNETLGALLIVDLESVIGQVLRAINNLEPGILASAHAKLLFLAGMYNHLSIEELEELDRAAKFGRAKVDLGSRKKKGRRPRKGHK